MCEVSFVHGLEAIDAAQNRLPHVRPGIWIEANIECFELLVGLQEHFADPRIFEKPAEINCDSQQLSTRIEANVSLIVARMKHGAIRYGQIGQRHRVSTETRLLRCVWNQ